MKRNNHGKEDKAASETARSAGAVQIYPQPLWVLKDPALEGTDDEGVSRLFHALKLHLYTEVGIKNEELLEYDHHIVRFTKEINENRREKITWKYYQYLALLFTEIYLDRYFSDKARLLEDINRFLIDDFNFRPET